VRLAASGARLDLARVASADPRAGTVAVAGTCRVGMSVRGQRIIRSN
jgi:hypothetical protein